MTTYNNFFGGAFFGGGFFGPGVEDVTGGKGDNDRGTYKPTGILERRPKLKLPEGRKTPAERIEDSRQLEAEVAGQLARELGEIESEAVPVEAMSLREIENEIAVLLRKKIRTKEDEDLLLLLMIATV